jgi:nucleotide-binding universal stress UspA family protein
MATPIWGRDKSRAGDAPHPYTGVMKTFLVPVDFSPITDEVIDTAVDFARAFNGRVILVHVVQPPVVTSEFALPAEVLQEAMVVGEKAGREKLNSLREQISNAGFSTDVKVLQGPPSSLIVDEAHNSGADYIIMGSHGHGKLYDLLVGSTASGVMKKARCGVILLPPAGRA